MSDNKENVDVGMESIQESIQGILEKLAKEGYFDTLIMENMDKNLKDSLNLLPTTNKKKLDKLDYDNYKNYMFARNAAARARVKFLKEYRGVSSKFIADLAGVGNSALTLWLQEKREFREKNLDKIEETFKLYNF